VDGFNFKREGSAMSVDQFETEIKNPSITFPVMVLVILVTVLATIIIKEKVDKAAPNGTVCLNYQKFTPLPLIKGNIGP
jgi:hypothetical protein